ncbi:MAG: heavy metal translocating P-type ATPase [Methylococcaceae bacterium]
MLNLFVLGVSAVGGALIHTGTKIYQQHREKKRLLKDIIVTDTPDTDVVVSDEKQEADYYLKVSAIGTGLTFVGQFVYTPLLIPAVSLVMYCCVPVFRKAVVSIKNKKMKASVITSIAILGELSTPYLYFASSLAATIYFVAQKLLLETEDQSKKQLSNIFGETPRSVWVIQNGVEMETPFNNLKVGDVIAIHAGEMIPIDGVVVHGFASVDQHIMTGEAQPVEKKWGDTVLAGTFAVSGELLIQVEKCGEETVAAKISEILQNTADFRFTVEAKSVQMSDSMVLPTLALGGIGLLATGPIGGVALVSCNNSEVIRVCAPIGVLNFIKLATEHGFLIKDGRSLELLNEVDTVVFDKTGTLTIEQPHVHCVHAWEGHNESDVLFFAAAAEYKQTHPVAKAILKAAQDCELILPRIENARYEVGYGIKVELDNQIIHVGSYRYIAMQMNELPDCIGELQLESHENGFSVVYVAVDNVVIGAIELHATVRPEARSVVEQLKSMGLDIYIISGDHEKPTRHLAESLGIDHYYAETLPENKAELVGKLQAEGKSVCFIGDGINDSIALKKANVSVSLHGASTAAIDTAGIILMDKELTQIPYLFELAKGLNRTVKQSVAVALVPGLIGVGGVFLFHFGIYTILMLYMASLVTGIANSMLPLLTHRHQDNQNDKKPD